jgi:hypothetical protein
MRLLGVIACLALGCEHWRQSFQMDGRKTFKEHSSDQTRLDIVMNSVGADQATALALSDQSKRKPLLLAGEQ